MRFSHDLSKRTNLRHQLSWASWMDVLPLMSPTVTWHHAKMTQYLHHVHSARMWIPTAFWPNYVVVSSFTARRTKFISMKGFQWQEVATGKQNENYRLGQPIEQIVDSLPLCLWKYRLATLLKPKSPLCWYRYGEENTKWWGFFKAWHC